MSERREINVGKFLCVCRGEGVILREFGIFIIIVVVVVFGGRRISRQMSKVVFPRITAKRISS